MDPSLSSEPFLPSAELQEGLFIIHRIQQKKDPKDFTPLLNLIRRCPHPSILIPLFDKLLQLFEEHTHVLGYAILQFAHNISFLLPRLVNSTPPSLLKHITRCFEKCHPESWLLTLKLLEVTLPITKNCDLIHHYVLLAFHEPHDVMLRAYRFSHLLLHQSNTFPSCFATWAESSIVTFSSVLKQKHILILMGCIQAPLNLSKGLYHVCLSWIKMRSKGSSYTPFSSSSSSETSTTFPVPSKNMLSSFSSTLASSTTSSLPPTVSSIYIQATALRLLATSPELTSAEITWILTLLHETQSPVVLSSVYECMTKFLPSVLPFQNLQLLVKGFEHPHVNVKIKVRRLLLKWIQTSISIPSPSSTLESFPFQVYFTDPPVTRTSFDLISTCLHHHPTWMNDPKSLIQWFLNHLVTLKESNMVGVTLLIDFAKVYPKLGPLLLGFVMTRFQDVLEMIKSLGQAQMHPSSNPSVQWIQTQFLIYSKVLLNMSPHLTSLPPIYPYRSYSNAFHDNVEEVESNGKKLFGWLLSPTSSTTFMLKNVLGPTLFQKICQCLLGAWLYHPTSLQVHLSSLKILDIESHYILARNILTWPTSPWVHVAAQIFQQLSTMTLSTSHGFYLEHWMYLAQGMSNTLPLLDAWQSAWLRLELCPFLFQSHVLQLDLKLLESVPIQWKEIHELAELYSFLLNCSPYLLHPSALLLRIHTCQCIAYHLQNPSLLHQEKKKEQYSQTHQWQLSKEPTLKSLAKLLETPNWTWDQLLPLIHSILKQLPRDYFRTHVPWFVELFTLPNPTNVPHVIRPNIDLALQTYGHLQTAGKSIGIQSGELGVLVCNRPLTKLVRDLPKRKALMDVVFELKDESDTAQAFRNSIQADYVQVYPVSVANDAFNQSIVIPFKYFSLTHLRYVVMIVRIKLPNGRWWTTNTVSTLAVQVVDS
ncbi:hypothetical protein HMI54_007197 [Coelomomyces lativittatus]|nr:hypothetical protein HMI55_005969 [Coelomomyces lativittatus]KAJ1517080.1 hypothetical protein HMI54_007197 [Coelomomyces lativittatus]